MCFVHLGLVQLKKALEELTELLAEKEELSQRCQELDIQVHFTHMCGNTHSDVHKCVDAASSAAAVHATVSVLAHINGLDAV